MEKGRLGKIDGGGCSRNHSLRSLEDFGTWERPRSAGTVGEWEEPRSTSES